MRTKVWLLISVLLGALPWVYLAGAGERPGIWTLAWTLLAPFICWKVVSLCLGPLRWMVPALDEIRDGQGLRRSELMSDADLRPILEQHGSLARDRDDRQAQAEGERSLKQTILEGMVDGVLVIDGDRRIVLVNSAAQDLVAGGSEAGSNLRLWEYCRMPELTEVVERCLTEEVDVRRELTMHEHTGDRVLELRATRIGGKAREGLHGCVVVIHDLSESRRIELMRRDFVANASHELKTPLTGMRGYLEALLEDPHMSETLRMGFLAKAAASTERLTAIVQDFLTLARLESHEDALHFEECELGELVHESVDLVRPSADIKAIEIATHIDDEELSIHCDRKGLGMAIKNLLENAVRYSPSSTRVEIATEQVGDEVIIRVRDQGQGIPEHEQERIFERFYRIDKNRSRKLGGTGLGLSIVRHAAGIHGGTVSVSSPVHPPGGPGVASGVASGVGSEFTLRLPRVHDNLEGGG